MKLKGLLAAAFAAALPLASAASDNVRAVAPPPALPAYQWHTFYNPSETQWLSGRGKAVATDSLGNIYVAGRTDRPLTFAPGAPVHAVPDNGNLGNVFVMKLNPAGGLVWYTFYSGPQGAGANGIAVDTDGSVYVTGNGALWGDGSQPPINNGGGQALFVLKLNNNGGFIWHTLYGDGDTGNAIAVDSHDPLHRYVYVTGYKYCCSGWPGTAIRDHLWGANDLFVLALDSNGAHWWHTFWGPGGGQGYAVTVDGARNIYVGGIQNGQNTIMKLRGPDAGEGWGALERLDLGSWGLGTVYGLATDSSNNLYAAGGTWPSWTGPLGQPPVHPPVNQSYGIFVLKLDSVGNYQRHTFFANNSSEQADSIALDGYGRVYITGRYPHYGDPGGFGANSLHNNGGQPGHYLAALNTDLDYQWHTVYGAYWDTSHGVAVDADRNVCVVGGSGQPWLGDNNALPLWPQGGGDSVFVQKFSLKTTPVVTWSNPAAIVFGSALGPGQLNATANVPGTFVYTPPAGTVLGVGNGQVLSVLFTPTDGANYTTAGKPVQINVLAAPQPPAGPRLVVTRTLSRAGSQVMVYLTVANTGGSAAQNVQLTVGRINSTSGTPLPQALGTIAAGGTANATLSVPGSVGNPGVAAVLTAGGTYTGGSFSSAVRITLP